MTCKCQTFRTKQYIKVLSDCKQEVLLVQCCVLQSMQTICARWCGEVGLLCKCDILPDDLNVVLCELPAVLRLTWGRSHRRFLCFWIHIFLCETASGYYTSAIKFHVNTTLETTKITNISLSNFLEPLNLKKLSLSIIDKLFFLKTGARLGMVFSGDVDGNLKHILNQTTLRFSIFFTTILSNLSKTVYNTWTAGCCPPGLPCPIYPSHPQ